MAAPTLSDSIRQVRDDLAGEGVSQVWTRRTFEAALAIVVGSFLWAFYRWVDEVRKQANPLTATGLFLRLWGLIWRMIPTDPATASGSILLTGNAEAVQPAGSIIIGPDGQEYTTDDSCTLVLTEGTAGAAFADVTASGTGDTFNLDPSTPMIVASPASGIAGAASVWTMNGGRTGEDDESFRDRLLSRIQRPADVGNVDDFARWAREASTSVARVWVYRCGRTGSQAGHVLTLFAVSGTNPIPSGGLVTTVAAYILGKSPAGSKPTTSAPTGQAVPLTIALDPSRDTSAARAIVAGYARQLFAVGSPGGTVPNRDLRAALSRAGIAYQLQSVNGGLGTADVVAASNLHLPYLGTITWGTWA